MSNINNDDNQDFFSDYNKPQDKLLVDIPASMGTTDVKQIHKAYDPIGEVYAQGRAMRGMSSTGISWWVLLTSWVFLGGLFLWLLSVAIFSSPVALPGLLIVTLPLLIVIRATFAKFSNKKRRRR
ncbi:hypothetical protein DSM106972_046250 [Dulcicalothrix desertica PCC 7102]|uniref:Uncharacterized protein n=1 Tax=Dulcicalothrix desertica PCC 7102 TaxID=232991 RepID=A0A433VEB4_9CYAN|nr:hypothetical protein [Dulcicalothrix desertica]RUT04397.1 hypothetical protein DSM106972_046250 [Dulcicalothrix desertica PCC 7102]TWH51251.1 hypothetical protein CAL7102_05645 [Dulcicalothrix desertica PCC 7102]